MPETLQAGDTRLQLNGVGVREKWWVDIYVAGLYLPKPSSKARAIIEAAEPQAIRLHMVSGLIDSEKMTSATRAGFQKATDGNTAPIQNQIDQFINVFRNELGDGDVFDIVYLPGKGVRVFKNGTLEGKVDCGMAFKRALFGIWLSDQPVQEALKAGLLGKR